MHAPQPGRTPTPLPGPRGYPLIGNLPQLLQAETPIHGMLKLCEAYGPIFELRLAGLRQIMVCGHEIAAELCDEQRFQKAINPGIAALRPIAGDGLFAVDSDEPVWGVAHRILMPAFKRDAMQRYLSTMESAVDELIGAWALRGPDEGVEVMPAMTRLTLDIIGRTGFGYRFGPLGDNDKHPFVEAMTEALTVGMNASFRPDVLNWLMVGERRRMQASTGLLHQVVDDIIAERRADPSLLAREDDLLSLMLTAVDPETGARLSDENARFQVVNFLIAGHETTAGLLSFALMYLARDPALQAKAAAEADEVLKGDAPLDYKAVLKLRFLSQVVQEALRLHPTVPGFAREPLEDTVLAGRYAVPKGSMVFVLLEALHREPAVWGEDAASFNPDRFAPERAAGRPRGAFLPFGTGARACIGRQFAQTEATLFLAKLLRRFEIAEHPSSRPQVQFQLTARLNGLQLALEPRQPAGAAQG